MKKRIFALFTAIILTLSITFAIPAIAFDGNDYGGGGGGDSWSNDSWSSDDSSSSSSETLDGAGAVIVLIIVFGFIGLIAWDWINSRIKAKKHNKTVEIENAIKERDPNFSSDELIAYVKQLYVDIQLAWCDRNLEALRPVLHENLYNTTVNQIKEKITQGVIYHYKDITVDNAYLMGLSYDDKFEYVSLFVAASMIDWQEDEKTGSILRGDKTTRWHLQYKMKLMRPLENVQNAVTKCPSCGAELMAGATSKCQYCGSVVRTDNHNWILNEFATYRSDTVDEGVQKYKK